MINQDKTFILKVGGEDREVFASFGLVNELIKIVGDPDRLATLALDHELRDKLVVALLAERKPSGRVIKAVEIDDIDVAPDDVIYLLDWATEHVLHFFVSVMTKSADRLNAAATATATKVSMPSTAGSAS